MSAPSQNPNAVVQASKDSSKGKRFFFEKKKQKTFDYLIPGCLLRNPFGWGGHAGGDSEPSAKSFVAFFVTPKPPLGADERSHWVPVRHHRLEHIPALLSCG
jgi:hypothetical protein